MGLLMLMHDDIGQSDVKPVGEFEGEDVIGMDIGKTGKRPHELIVANGFKIRAGLSPNEIKH